MELQIVKFFNRWGWGTKIDFLTRAISYIPFLGISWSAIAMAIFFLDKHNGHRITIAMTMAIGLHFIITAGLIKRFLGRYFKKNRPYIAYSNDIFPLGKRHIDSSFPSSHMSANLALLVVVAYFYPSIMTVAIVWALGMAFARLHNGMHYLSDVVAGAVLGVLYGIVGIAYAQALIAFIF
jgi:undecaprenyl-diphosphatase